MLGPGPQLVYSCVCHSLLGFISDLLFGLELVRQSPPRGSFVYYYTSNFIICFTPSSVDPSPVPDLRGSTLPQLRNLVVFRRVLRLVITYVPVTVLDSDLPVRPGPGDRPR